MSLSFILYEALQIANENMKFIIYVFFFQINSIICLLFNIVTLSKLLIQSHQTPPQNLHSVHFDQIFFKKLKQRYLVLMIKLNIGNHFRQMNLII